MRRPFVLLAALSAACATSQPTPPLAEAPPPVIDREAFFGNPEIAGAQLSPDGQFLSFMKDNHGVMNVWVKRRTEPFEAARPLTADTKRPIGGYFWSQDSKYVLFAQDKGGDENFHGYAVDPTAAAEPATGVPAARDLTPFEKMQARIIAVPELTPETVLVGMNDRDAEVHDVYKVDIRTGQRTLVLKNDANIVGWTADLDGNLRLGMRLAADGGTEILRVDFGKLTSIYSCGADEDCAPVRFHKDGKRVYLETNKGDPDLSRLVLLDVATGREELVDADPAKEVDFGGAAFSRATHELVATFYEGDRLRTYPKDPTFARDWELVTKALPGVDVHFRSPTRDDRFHLIGVTSDVDPGATYLYDRQSGKVEFLYRPFPKLPIEHLATMKPVRIAARDGVVIPAYLTLPKGVSPKALPTVLLPHGGPWARDSWGYEPIAQFLANRGYAVLQPNFRGSEGFGKKFLNLGNKQWGTGTMQHDLSDCAAWLTQQGYADAKRIAIMGGSYGGYATLAGMAFTPDLYAAGVDIVGPSNIITLLKTIPPYWAPLKKKFAVRVGDLDQSEDVERLKSQSPLHRAKEIKAPLLVIQGANDPRVKKAESDQIVSALRDLSRPVEYLVAPDEGHGFHGRVNRIAMFAVIEKFLGKHLGGRAQESMPTEIAQKVAAITVDPATVKLLTPVALAIPVDLPTFSSTGIRAGKLRYAQKGEAMGKVIDNVATWTLAKGKRSGHDVWIVTNESKTSMGAAHDTTWMDGKTLLPVSREIRQGPAHIQLSFDGASVKGKLETSGRMMPVDANVGTPVLTEGTPLQLAVSRLPLKLGYRVALRTFDLQSGGAKQVDVEVKGTEQVAVPAGTFGAYRVELAFLDGSQDRTTLWVEQKPAARIVKWEENVISQHGGRKIVGELLK